MSVVTAPPAGRKLRLSFALTDRLISFASPIALLLVWEVAARAGFIDVRFFPAPSSIFVTLLAMMESGELWIHLWMSLKRLTWGYLLGGVPALVLGIVMGLSRPVRATFEPLISALYPIPKSSIVPLALLIFGLGEGSKVFMVALGVFFPIAINSTAGVLEINKIYLDVGKNFKAGRWSTFRYIALPGALPVILTGIRLGVGMGLVLIAIAEMVGAKSGLGYMIWNAWETFAVEQMYVGLFVIAMIGLALNLLLNEIEKILVPWRR
ncbi:MAG: ABC transporter permease [Pseudorhodoplanes sp.]|nr:ABC transporter permease [Pseudorhodoplanes sp.]